MTQLNPIFDDDSNITADDLRDIPKILTLNDAAYNPFPVEIFPSPFREFILETEKALNYPIDYTGMAILSAVSTAIGKSAQLMVKFGWFEFPALYAALVGQPGAAKSHPIDLCFRVIRDIDRAVAIKDAAKFDAYNKYMKMSKKEKMQHDEPEKPIIIKSVLDNFTPEILHQRLADNHRGCAVVTDELATFLDLMNNYSKGDLSSIYLSFWSNKSTSIDRVSKDLPLFISHPFLNIMGSLQPKVIARLFPPSKSDSGFLQRFLFAFNPFAEKMPISDNEINPSVIDDYIEWIRHYIRDNPANLKDDNLYPDPKLYYWSPQAKNFFYTWQRNNTREVNRNKDSLLGEVLNKFDIHFPRLALILQIMSDNSTNQISLSTVQSVARLCEYFINSSKYVLNIIEYPGASRVLPADKQEFLDKLPRNFTTSEALELGFSLQLHETAINTFISRTDLFNRTSHGKYSKK